MSDSPENSTFASRLGHNFLTGLFLLLPIGLTLYVVSVLLDLMGKFIQPVVEVGLRWLWVNPNHPAPRSVYSSLGNNLTVVANILLTQSPRG